MNSKQKIEKLLRLEDVKEDVVSVHWWGMYKYEVAGLDYRKAMFRDGKSLVSCQSTFVG